MKQFGGFPARLQFTPIPNLFISNLLPDIDDIAELKVTLHIFRIAYARKGAIRSVSVNELLADKALLSSLAATGKPVAESLRGALEKATERGTILRLTLTRERSPEDVYFVNMDADRRIVEKIKNGEMSLAGLKAGAQGPAEISTVPPPDIFTLYEQNIGMLTPLIADDLREAEKIYPKDWIEDAFKEAAHLNKRSWRYIDRILENWSSEGRGDGADRRNSKAGAGKPGKQDGAQIFQR